MMSTTLAHPLALVTQATSQHLWAYVDDTTADIQAVIVHPSGPIVLVAGLDGTVLIVAHGAAAEHDFNAAEPCRHALIEAARNADTQPATPRWTTTNLWATR